MIEIKIMVVGMRGFPDVMGGVETHGEELYPLLVEKGCEITVAVRTNYMKSSTPATWRGVRFVRIWAPRVKSLEAIVHTFLGVLYAGLTRPDILHIHAVGPSLFTPLAKLFGLRVVMTHHGTDYKRAKWGSAVQRLLKLGEKWGMRFANGVIVISEELKAIARNEYYRDCALIRNGVNPARIRPAGSALSKYGLSPYRYALMVSRIVPEKRHLDLMKAFLKAKLDDWHLVLVGGSDHPDNYFREVMKRAKKSKQIICTGFVPRTVLEELYSNAGFFVFPTAQEGHPIAVLEALSYGLHVIASDIPAHKELAIPGMHIVPLGDTDTMGSAICGLAMALPSKRLREEIRTTVTSEFSWTKAALFTMQVYEQAVG